MNCNLKCNLWGCLSGVVGVKCGNCRYMDYQKNVLNTEKGIYVLSPYLLTALMVYDPSYNAHNFSLYLNWYI